MIYEQELAASGKDHDSIVSLKGLPEELKRLVTLVLLDAVSAFFLEQQDTADPGFREAATTNLRSLTRELMEWDSLVGKR